MSQMRYEIQVQAFQVLDGAQVTVWVREHSSDPAEPPARVARRAFTVVELDVTGPERWARDVLVAAAERF